MQASGFCPQIASARAFPQVSLGRITDLEIEAQQRVLFKKNTPKETAAWLGDEINKALKTQNELSGG